MSITGVTRRAIWSAVFAVAFPLIGSEPLDYTFCAYNLKNWLSMERFDSGTPNEATPKPLNERKRVIEFLTDIRPDVLGVCEVGTDTDVADLQKRLKYAGVDLPHIERSNGGDPTRSLALLSRFPITASHSKKDLKYQIGDQTFPMQRGILDATVELAPGLQVRFVGVHLKSKRAIPGVDESIMRRNEAHLLRSHIDSIFVQDEKVKLLCYGDFNEHRNEPAIAEIIGSRAAENYMIDLSLHDADGLVWTHFWDSADVYSRLDFLFSSRALRPLIDLRKARIYSARDFDKASDHRPLVLKITPR
jgi:endonuclease/exonuclease/phosphatase family metal-dependent hydrolase